MSTHSDRQHLQSLVDSTRQLLAARAEATRLQLPYAAPDRRANPALEAWDWLRVGMFVLAASLFGLTVLAYAPAGSARAGSELFNVSLIQDFALPLLAIYLVISAFFALTPPQVAARRQRAAGVYACVMAALLGCALTLEAAFMTWPAFVLALGACAAGLLGIRELNRHTARSNWERLLTDAPLGLCTGFILVFTAHLFFAATGWDGGAYHLLVLGLSLALAVIASVAAHSERGRHSLALGFAVGMTSVALSQWLDDAASWWLSVASVLCAIIVLVAAENRRYQVTHAEHRAARGLPADF